VATVDMDADPIQFPTILINFWVNPASVGASKGFP